ncbi:hypothetical protein MHYP_G00000020 [Metynnis hypsauchen]
MMLNASSFVTHVKTFYPEMSILTNAQFDCILLQFKKLQKDNSRRIKAHQQIVKWKKLSDYMSFLCSNMPNILAFCLTELLRPSSNLGTFMHLAEYKVPKLTDMIWRRPHAHLFKLLQDYLAGYLAILTGHRPVVFINLQKAKLQAEVDDQNRAVVWVSTLG